MNRDHVGSDFDSVFIEAGEMDSLADITIAASKRVFVLQLLKEMKRQKLTKTELAKRMGTTRRVLDRMLNPDEPSVTMKTMARAAAAVGKSLRIGMVDKA